MVKQEQKLFRVSAAAHELGLHPMTVRRWIKAGRLQAIEVGREVRIPRSEIERIVGTVPGRILVLYGRASGPGQQADLSTQLEALRTWAASERPGVEVLVLSDVGSGLNARRRQLQRLLHLVRADRVSEIAITDEDRLTRFGQDYLAVLFSCCDVQLTILHQGANHTPDEELTADLLALIASFAGRLYGKRSHKQKALVQCAQTIMNTP